MIRGMTMKTALLALLFVILANLPALAVEQDWKTLGVLDSLTDEQIVISDSTYRMAETVIFLDQDGNRISEQNFELGMRVLVGFDDEGKVEAVWHIEELRP